MNLGAVALALVAAALFALALVLTQFGLRSLSPLSGASISIPASALLFILLSPFTIGVQGWHGGSAALFALAGVFFPIAVTLMTFASNRRIGATLTGAFGNFTPLFAVVAALALIGDVPTIWQAVGILTIVGGALSLVRTHPSEYRSWRFSVLLLPVGAAALRGIVQPLVKLGLTTWANPFAAATISYAVSAIIVLSLRSRISEASRLDKPGVLWFSAVGICNGGAVLAMYSALEKSPVTLVAPLVATYPLAVMMLERSLLGLKGAPGLAGLAGVSSIAVGAMLLLAAP